MSHGLVLVLSSDDDDECTILAHSLPAKSVRSKRKRKVIDLTNSPTNHSAKHQKDTTHQQQQIPVRQKQHQPEIQNCAICLESIPKGSLASTKCGHVFCFECIKQAVISLKRCPTCRCKLNKKDFHRLFI
eukprot:TRINITY_DN22977_c0_g1_i1.p1 TRINITY_DN22977_c0_g1~~TRINITY_DN22977_c0_g1_i1.p1  ORF type:complete len:130 (-),score=23.22 TRINITY_DN22977_c0_g1_i1:405-794(-)